MDISSRLDYCMILMGIPYQAIGIGIGVISGIWSFLIADTTGGKIFILLVLAALFFLPVVWRHQTASLLSFIGWIGFAIGCLIFIQWQKAR